MVFGIVLVVALVFDLGLLSPKNKTVSIRQAFYQTIFWVSLALVFFGFLWIQGPKLAAEDVHADPAFMVTRSQLPLEFLSAYLMEWSLSIDNIFVFILIFSSFNVSSRHYPRVLLLGILMAIIFRVIFITVGVALVSKFEWILYLFGIFLVYTGYKMFSSGDDDEFDPHETKLYRWLRKVLPLTKHDGDGRYWIKENGRRVYTSLFVVVILLAGIDLVFALDSIPAVMGISRDSLVIYTSNIFAVLGLRSLFFLLRGAVSKFDYLQQGIAVVLVFIGIKMLGDHYISQWLGKNMQVLLSLGVIVVCIAVSILYSIAKQKKGTPPDSADDSA